jgi:2',3'-cyclic-nucleotide 2'-phosphodiesterase/3'-nucleotidase
VTPETDNHWRITGINLQEEDPRRAEIVSWINTGCLPVPYEESYNLADYDTLAEKMKTVTETK